MEVLANSSAPMQSSFNPYQNNEGTALAVSGKDYVVIAADTRISVGYAIHTRHGKKLAKLTHQCVLGTSGMQADFNTLHKILQSRMQQYEYQHKKPMSTASIAQMLSNTLYYKRFFPYYTWNVLAGLDDEGRGAVYNFDVVGSYQRVPVACVGSGESLIQPLLDNQIDRAHQQGLGRWEPSELEAVELVKDAFSSAGERDIHTGDHVRICIINKDGVREEIFDLKYD